MTVLDLETEGTPGASQSTTHDQRTSSSSPVSPSTLNGATAAVESSTAASSSSQSPRTPRRSAAHHPRLLGLVEGGGVMELRGLGISTSPADSPSEPMSSGSRSLAKPRTLVAQFDNDDQLSGAEDHFRLHDDTDDDDNDDDNGNDDETLTDQSAPIVAGSSNQSKRKTGQGLAPIRVDSYGGLRGYQIEQDEQTAIFHQQNNRRQASEAKDETDIEREAALYDDQAKDANQEDDEGSSDGHNVNNLDFETTTAREKLWMWVSVGLVVALTIISVAIAVDWIDWPGDGIGKD